MASPFEITRQISREALALEVRGCLGFCVWVRLHHVPGWIFGFHAALQKCRGKTPRRAGVGMRSARNFTVMFRTGAQEHRTSLTDTRPDHGVVRSTSRAAPLFKEREVNSKVCRDFSEKP